MDFIEKIYRSTERFPHDERFGLITQMRRAAISIATNIAEGAARRTAKETTQFFFISRGSISELDTQIEIAHRLGFVDGEGKASLALDLDELSRLLSGLISSKQTPQSPNRSITQSLNHPITESLHRSDDH